MNLSQPRLSILVVDDNPHNRLTIINIISSLVREANIDEAGDGRMAIGLVYDLIQKHGKSYDLIFMDFEMPNLNGQETTFAIRKLEQPLPKKSYIITWSSAKIEPLQESDAVLPKPLDLDKLENILLSQGYISRQ